MMRTFHCERMTGRGMIEIHAMVMDQSADAQVSGLLLAALSRLLPRQSWSSFFVTSATRCAGTGS